MKIIKKKNKQMDTKNKSNSEKNKAEKRSEDEMDIDVDSSGADHTKPDSEMSYVKRHKVGDSLKKQTKN
jgi:hypothetical protein